MQDQQQPKALTEQEEGYMRLLEEKRDYLKKIYPLDTNDWQFEQEKDGVTIHSILDDKTGLKIIRANCIMRAPAKKILDFTDKVDVVLEWDKSLGDVKALYESKDYKIMYIVIKKLPLVVQRDSIVVAKYFNEGDDTVYVIATSIDRPEVEKTIYKVRSTVHLIGWVMKSDPTNPDITNFTIVLHLDPEGWIPKSVFNWFAHTQGFNIRLFGDYVEKRYIEYRSKEEEDCVKDG